MAMDTFIVFAASYGALRAAEADFQTVREFYMVSGLLDAYDAAVITRDDAGKVRIAVKHERPGRQGAWRGLGIGLAGGALVALFPAVRTGAGLLPGPPGGAGLGVLAGHVSAGLTRADLADLGELLDEGHSGLLVVAASDVADRVEHVIRHASKLTRKPLRVDETAVAADIEVAATGPDQSYRQAVAQSEAAVREAEAEAAAAERAAEQYSAYRPRPGGDDLVSSLDDLARLRESGVLSPEEFEAAKSKLLGQ
jgi:uncharacterized membrane protein